MDNQQNGGVRLNKLIADSGYCSRREADKLITQGSVKVNGRTGQLGDKVGDSDYVTVNGKAVKPQTPKQKVYIALNKPVGIVSTTERREPSNVIDFIGHPQRIFPIGRLDKDSQGLLLLTSDGEIVNKVLRAAGRHEKEYVVTVNKPITPDFLQQMAGGVRILDRVTLPAKIQQEGKAAFRIVLVQGLNRQIRRMCEALGYKVLTLKRVRIMNIHLSHLKEGHWRNLSHAELSELIKQTQNYED